MSPDLKPGVVRSLDFTVVEAMCPRFEGGPIVHRVCSTWTLAHQFEVAGRLVLVDYLEAHEEGVGSHVSVDHVGPARVGRMVRVTATATEVTDRTLVCDTVAAVDGRVIATGRTVQGIFPREVLQRLMERG